MFLILLSCVIDRIRKILVSQPTRVVQGRELPLLLTVLNSGVTGAAAHPTQRFLLIPKQDTKSD